MYMTEVYLVIVEAQENRPKKRFPSSVEEPPSDLRLWPVGFSISWTLCKENRLLLAAEIRLAVVSEAQATAVIPLAAILTIGAERVGVFMTL